MPSETSDPLLFPLLPDAGPIVRAVWQHWEAIRPAADRLPGRQHFDIVALGRSVPAAVPCLWLLDVETDPVRFRYRLVGGALVASGNRATVGSHLGAIDRVGRLTSRLMKTWALGQPSYRRGPPSLDHSRYVREVENIALPLAHDGRSVDMILCCSVFHWDPGFAPAAGLLDEG